MKKFFITKKTKYALCALTLIPLGLMGEYGSDPNLHYEQYVAVMTKSAQRKQKRRVKRCKISKKEQKRIQAILATRWSPHLVYINYIQEKRSPFFQFNVGSGFLYFSGVKGNLGGVPTVNFQTPLPNYDSVPYQGKISYNKTPLFEYVLGYRLLNWFKIGFSYQHQGGVSVNTEGLIPAHDINGRVRFSSNLNIDAIMAKVFFEAPWALVIKNCATSAYLGLGLGPSWQSWTRNRVEYIDTAGLYRNRFMVLNNKSSVNASLLVDVGVRLQDSIRKQHFSAVIGCKYNLWGQARSIGSFGKQDQYFFGLNSPFRIKTVYSFAPYVGVQWNFPPNDCLGMPIMVQDRYADTWTPFWTGLNEKVDSGIWTQFNVGPGLLYFKGQSGLIVANGSGNGTVPSPTQFAPLRGGVSYNRTPLFEYLLGWKIFPWLRAGLGIQSQSQVNVQTKWQTSVGRLLGAPEAHFSQLSASVNLNSVMLRAYYDSHFSMVWKNLLFTPYVGAGIGPGWQTWRNINVQDVLLFTGNGRNNNPRFIKRKTSANATWLLDLGLKIKSLLPGIQFSVAPGIKFMYWGQSRNIGLLSQQGGSKQSLVRPLTFKYVFSFVPYLGVNWNFPLPSLGPYPHEVDGRITNTWKPFFTHSYWVQPKSSLWTQFNMGIGLLYFSNTRVTLSGTPSENFNFEAIPTDQTSKLQYNRTPLYDYMIGYRFNDWISAALSYQHQAAVSVQTEPQDGVVPATNGLVKSTFRSNLELDAISVKGYLELPYAMIFKQTATSPYLGVSIGLGWQTWDATVQHIRLDPGFINYVTQQPLRSKISANAVWGLDLGIRSKGAFSSSQFSVSLGCKYNQWGQARNVGAIEQQGSIKAGISEPFTVKTVYQFAPYLGVQWDF